MEKNAKILIIDDEIILHDALESILAAEGYDLFFATTAKEGIELVRRIRPDVILLDVMMPDQDGYEVCQFLRHVPEVAAVPIVMMSSLADRGSRLRGLEAGADEFLEKPFDKLELRIRLRTLTRLNRFRILQEERSRFEWVIENLADGVLMESEDGTIRFANATARRWLFMAPGTDIRQLKLSDLRDRHYRLRGSLLSSTPQQESLENWTFSETPTAPSYVLEVRWRQAYIEGESGRVALLRDITDAVEHRRMSNIFQSVVSHKLRTPLNALNGSFEIMTMEEPKFASSEYGTYMGNAIRSLIELNDDLLRYIDPNLRHSFAGKFPTALLGTLVKKTATALGYQNAPTFTAAAHISSTKLPFNESGCSLLLQELLSNSLKFHPHGKPQVNVNISLTEDKFIRLEVLDDGVSLSAKQLADITLPFTQAEKHLTGNVPGWGLGLALIEDLTECVHGRFNISNRPDGVGIRVALEIPSA